MPSLTDSVMADYGNNFRASMPGDYTYPKEAASQTFIAGDVLISSSGKAAIGAAAGSSLTSSSKILGFALNAATGTTDSVCPVQRIVSNTVWEIPIWHATAGSAVSANSMVGGVYQLYHHATIGWAVDLANTSDPVVQIVGWRVDHPIGESYAIARVQFIDGVTV